MDREMGMDMVATGYMRMAVRIAVLTLTHRFPLKNVSAGLHPRESSNAVGMPQKNALGGGKEVPVSKDVGVI